MTDGAAIPPVCDAPEPTHDELLARLPLDKRRKIEAALVQLAVIHNSGKKVVEWEAGSWRILALGVYWLGLLGLGFTFWSVLCAIAIGTVGLSGLPVTLALHPLFITASAWSRRPALRLIAAANGVVNAGFLLTFAAQLFLQAVLYYGPGNLTSAGFLLFAIFPSFLLWLNLKWTLVEHRLIAKTVPADSAHSGAAVAEPTWRLHLWREVATVPGWYLIWMLLNSLVLNPNGPANPMSVVAHLPPVLVAVGLLVGGLFINNLRLRLIAAACMVVLAYVMMAFFLLIAWLDIGFLWLPGLFGLAAYAGWRILQADIAAYQRQVQGETAPNGPTTH